MPGFNQMLCHFFEIIYYFLLPLDTQACQLILHDRNSKEVEKGLTGQAVFLRRQFPPSEAPNDCFLWNICSEKQILPRIFYHLRTAKNFWVNVPLMYNFWSLSNKFIMIFWSLIFTFHLLVRLFSMEKRKNFVILQIAPKILGKIIPKPLYFPKDSSSLRMTKQLQIL